MRQRAEATSAAAASEITRSIVITFLPNFAGASIQWVAAVPGKGLKQEVNAGYMSKNVTCQTL